MGWIITILIGALIGWIASAIAGTSLGLIGDIFVGIIGALLGRWLFGSILGIGSAAAAGTWSFWGILWGVVGAVILLLIVKAFTR